MRAVYSLFKVIFAMYARRKKGFPSGGSWRRRRLMRGDQSAPAQHLQNLTPPHTKRARSRTLPKLCTAPNDKNFHQEHPHHAKRNNSLPCKGGCSWGKFSEGVGGLEGEGRLFQEASLSLQGLPPSKVFQTIRYLTPSRESGESAAGAEANAFFALRSETGTW